MFPVCTMAPWLAFVAVSADPRSEAELTDRAPVCMLLMSMDGNASPTATSPLKPAVVALARLLAMTSCRI